MDGDIHLADGSRIHRAGVVWTRRGASLVLQTAEEVGTLLESWPSAAIDHPISAEGRTLHHEVKTFSRTPLCWAVATGEVAVVSRAIARGADINCQYGERASALFIACQYNHVECARLLLDNGAQVDLGCVDGRSHRPPMHAACQRGHLDCVQLLSAYAAPRSWDPDSVELSAVWVSKTFNHPALVDWLERSEGWTELHHIETLSAERVRLLLRGGADVHASCEGVSPLDRAEGLAPQTSAAALVQTAAQPWSRETHALFPPAARSRARELMTLGHLLAKQARFATQSGALLDSWTTYVMAHAVRRPRILAAGQRVIVQGVVSRPQLNGKQGCILRYVPLSERYHVVMDGFHRLPSDAEVVSLRYACVRFVSESTGTLTGTQRLAAANQTTDPIHATLRVSEVDD
jgi:hypothetical protein